MIVHEAGSRPRPSVDDVDPSRGAATDERINELAEIPEPANAEGALVHGSGRT